MPAIYASALAQTLKSQPKPLIVLLWGEDAGAIRQSSEQVLTHLTQVTGTSLDDPFAASTITLPDVYADPTRLPDAALTMTFGGGHRLIRLTGVGGTEKKEELTALTEAVKAILAANPEGTTLVLPVPKLLDKKSALVTAVEKHANSIVVRFFADTARDLTTHIQTFLNTAQKRLEPAAQALLVANLGADRDIATRELEKLVLYVGDADTITEADVHESLAGAMAVDIFRLAEAVGTRNTALADKLLETMIEQGEDLNGAFTATIRHLQKIQTLQQALQNGASPDSALAQLKPPPPKPAQASLLQQARNYPAKRLAQLPALLVETLGTSRSGTLSTATSHLPLKRALLSLAV